MIRTWTDAPAEYDGFGTKTVQVVGRTARGTVRIVETPVGHVTWQRGRYDSGMYLSCDADRWLAIRDYVLLTGPGGEPVPTPDVQD